MSKKKLNHTDLTSKELEILKETYIDLKVNSMTLKDLKDYATENISLQIKSTIGNDEELEAWQEMEEFFKDEFENKIREIKINMESKSLENTNSNNVQINIKTEVKEEEKKLDMWED
tara:strand:+ start:335 stop:685 length:351 start_codon:yes stop_codon:yes gene_type:complete